MYVFTFCLSLTLVGVVDIILCNNVCLVTSLKTSPTSK